MKIELHIPVEQYGFVSATFETENVADIPTTYDSISNAFKPHEGLKDKEFNQFVDSMLEGNDNHIEQWEKMSDKQRDVAQVIKRALKRINYKNKD